MATTTEIRNHDGDATMRTVGEVARLANVTVRTLHHYDEIGLVRATGRTDAGYRLYGDADIERLQTVLFYRELGFRLDEIRTVMRAPDFDRERALRQQRELLTAESGRLQRMIRTIDAAIDAHARGTTMSEEAMFEVFGEEQRAYSDEAEQRWGDTDAYRQSQRRTAAYTRQDWVGLEEESERIMERIAEVYRDGAAPDSEPALEAVEAHRRQISARFYDCSHEMQRHLGEMYVQDARFAATYETLAAGLAVWVRDAIRANADRAAASPGRLGDQG